MANLYRRKAICLILFSALIPITLAAQQFSDLLTFNGANGGNPGLDPLVHGADGSFYGTTQYGGANTCGAVTCGTVFKITPAGKLTTLYNFCAQPNCADGANPWAGLILATDGNFYGATYFYGANGYGTVFKLTPTGKLTTLYSFCSQANCADGANPMGRLLQARDGNFYGTTSTGGVAADCCGTIFRVTPGGILTTIHVVTQDFGDTPSSGLVEGTDGNFYGIDAQGGNQGISCLNNGASGCGTVFKVTPTGVLTTLYGFCPQDPCTDGASPSGPLMLGNDGNFYGTTSSGGGHAVGEVFKMTPQGKLTTLYSFCPGKTCADGAYPSGALIQATDGAFYGTADQGGDMTGRCGNPLFGCGTLFRITRGGRFTRLHAFDMADGFSPVSGLLQATDGTFYGTTYEGGYQKGHCFFDGCGKVFTVSTGLGPFVSFVGNSGAVGQTRGILGLGFTGTTSVSFNGTPANFTVVSDTFIMATVPVGATSGYVKVTTPTAALKSNVSFRVIP